MVSDPPGKSVINTVKFVNGKRHITFAECWWGGKYGAALGNSEGKYCSFGGTLKADH